MTCTVIVAFFVQPSNTLGGQTKDVVDLANEERYQERLRIELGLPGATVRLFREGTWEMRPVESRRELKRSDVFTEFVGHAAIALDELQVADEVVTRFAHNQFEELYLPATGQVILFQAITARCSMLGQLLETDSTPRVTKQDVFFVLGLFGTWFFGSAVFFAISGRLDDEPISTIAILVIGMVSMVGAVVVNAMENARRRILLVAILVVLLVAAAFFSAEELATTIDLSD
jgi:hypothetical protein